MKLQADGQHDLRQVFSALCMVLGTAMMDMARKSEGWAA